MGKKIVITGSNKGIGFTTLDKLLKLYPDYEFVMAVRSTENGENALTKLMASHPKVQSNVTIMHLDISHSESIDKFVAAIKSKYGKIDCLINNAAMAFKGDTFNEEVVRVTFLTNYYGTKELTEKMKSLINNNGKIILIGSMAGRYNKFSADIQRRFIDAKNVSEIDKLAKEFYAAVVDFEYKRKGWPETAYGTSKALIMTYNRILSKEEDILRRNIQVYSLCPGWCRTDMAGQKASKSAEEGAETPTFLVGLPWEINQDYQGQFFEDCKVSSLLLPN
jgi:NAD(P)-dependent dehydrogenase (short-subunit alcohol dehydrogenase family)